MSTITRKPKNSDARVRTYCFRLVLCGQPNNSDDLGNALFEAGCDDATLAFQNGELFLDFDRESTSFKKAVTSAIQDVKATGVVRVNEVRPIDHADIEQVNKALIILRCHDDPATNEMVLAISGKES